MLFLMILEYIVLYYNLVECKKKKKKEIYLLTTFCVMRSSDVSKVDSQSASQKVSTVLPVEIITITNLNVRIYQKKSPQ